MMESAMKFFISTDFDPENCDFENYFLISICEFPISNFFSKFSR